MLTLHELCQSIDSISFIDQMHFNFEQLTIFKICSIFTYKLLKNSVGLIISMAILLKFKQKEINKKVNNLWCNTCCGMYTTL